MAKGLRPSEIVSFSSPESALEHEGELVNESKTNYTRKVKVDGHFYYVKRYLRPGKYLRRLVGRSRVKREWLNAAWFANHDIPTPRRVAFGEDLRGTDDYWGIIVCEEVTGTLDLRRIYQEQPDKLENWPWRQQVIRRLAAVVCRMHEQGFIHNDLQWRNILVELGETPEVYIIDCPAGRKLMMKGNRRGVIRDLAFLDKMASRALSQVDRLRFYKLYAGIARLDEYHKQEIRRVLSFFGK